MRDSFLPDLEITGAGETFEQSRSVRSSSGGAQAASAILMSRFAEIVSNTNAPEEGFTDHLMANVFQQQFSGKLFDFLGGYVC